MFKADSLSVLGVTAVAALEHAPPTQTATLQIIAMVLPWIPKIIVAIKARRATRKASKNV